GGVIELPRRGTVLDPADMPELMGKEGEDIVTSSGDTLLGADDKAGVAEIMAALAHLAAHPELPRPTLRVCFTPDEEVGEGATLFDIERFGALGAYTMDGSDLGELQDETFAAEEVVAHEPRARLGIEVVEQYPNMRSYLEPYPEIVGAAERAIRAEGVEVLHRPIRGGTDGSVLSARGLPTPNIFAGGHEFHS